MDPSREPFLRRSQQSILPSGQAYYTLESLEGATSLPFLNPALPASLPRRESFPPPHPLERDALLRLEKHAREMLALAADREALLRNLPGRATALPDQRMYEDKDREREADGLQALDARARASLDGLQNLDPRARTLLDNGRVLSHGLNVRPGAPLSDNRGLSHSLDMRPCDPLQLVSRAPPVVGGIAPGATEHGPLSESLRGRELSVGAPFLTAADPTLGRRERDIGRAEVPTSLPRRESFLPPHPLERDALRLDKQARQMLALAAERETLLRHLPGRATALPDQRMYADELQALDARARAGLDVRPGAPLSDNRGLSHSLDMRSHDPLQLVSRAPPVVGGIAPGTAEHGPLSESLCGRELSVGAPFLTAADPTLGQRERDIRRAEVPDVGAQSARLFANGSREPAATRSVPAEASKVKNQAERNKGLSNSKPSTAAAKINPHPEQSEGWCAVCKIECQTIETLRSHINGKKHKAVVEQLQGNTVKVEAASKAVDKVNSVPSTSQAGKKRASDEKPETSQSAKRLKASTPVVTSNVPTAVATDDLLNPSHQFCEICNIPTGDLESHLSHLKGKRHAGRVRWNLKRNLKKSMRILRWWSQPPSF